MTSTMTGWSLNAYIYIPAIVRESGGGGWGGGGEETVHVYACVCACRCVCVCVHVCVLCNVPIYECMLALKCKQESIQL